MPLNTQALSNKFGVAITGVDLSKELDEKLFDEIVDVFVKKRCWFFAINISSLNIKLPSAGGLAPSKCSMTRISGCRAFRRLPSSPMRRSMVNSLASSRQAISGIRTSRTDGRLRS